MRSLLFEAPKIVACFVLPVYAGLIGGSLGGFFLYALAAGFGLTLGEWILERFGPIQMTEIATCMGFWFGQAIIFGFPAFGLGRLMDHLI